MNALAPKPETASGPVQSFADEGRIRDSLERIADFYGEPSWLRRFRRNSLNAFHRSQPIGNWAPGPLGEIDLAGFHSFSDSPFPERERWSELTPAVQRTLEPLGVPAEEAAFLGGVRAQIDNTAVYARLRRQLSEKGVLFVGPSEGLTRHAALFRPWFTQLAPPLENACSALNAACFSGGNFLYVPPGVKVELPLKAFFHLEGEACGQFGRSLLIADEGSEVTFMEGCTSGQHNAANLHLSVGEIVARKNARIQYVSLQNWSSAVYNLVVLRGLAFAGAEIRWIDANVGSRFTMKYPSVRLQGERARGEMLSIAVASNGQYLETGAKMIHAADHTGSTITSKSISTGAGRADYRGLVEFRPETRHGVNHTECDALLINARSRTDTYPAISVRGGKGNRTQHEATVSKVSAEQLFYMKQRGLSEQAALSLSVNGFINDLVRAFPLEYSAQLKRLIELEMAGSVG